MLIDEFMPPEQRKLVDRQPYNATPRTMETCKQSDTIQQSVSSTRKFHQTMIVGFVEACKGVCELYDLSGTDLDDNKVFAVEKVHAYLRLQAMIQLLIPRCVDCILSSLKSFFRRYYAQLYLCHKLEVQNESSSTDKSRIPDQSLNPFDETEDSIAGDIVDPNVQSAQVGMYSLLF
jgi:hypothetical protein